MAREATNRVVAALRERQRIELAAAAAVVASARRRAAAEAANDIAVAVLAQLLGGDEQAAAVLERDVAEVTAARRRAAVADVKAEVARLRGRSPVRGRGAGRGGSVSAVRGGEADSRAGVGEG